MRLPARFPVIFISGAVGLISIIGVVYAQRPFKEYPAVEYVEGQFPLPEGWNKEQHEWVRARLRYPDVYGYPDRPIIQLARGMSRGPVSGTMDYPRSDRHLL